jgi:Tol biopolymer transport system component
MGAKTANGGCMRHGFGTRGYLRVASVAGVLAATLACAVPSQAAFPGANGRIAYDIGGSVPGSGTPYHQIWTLNPDGSDPRLLTPDTADNTDPTWSPDGRWIAFVSDRTGEPQIYVMRSDGTGRRQITRAVGGATQPAWSPGGLFLVYAHGGDLWTITAIGVFAHRLTHTPDVDESAPAWSPKGLRIAYTSAPANADPSARLRSIWTIRIDGRKARNLSAVTPAAPGLEDADPDWSPDGSKIVFDTRRGESDVVNGTGIWVMNADGTAPHVLMEGGYFIGRDKPVFSPDGGQTAEGVGGHGFTDIEVDTLSPDGEPSVLTRLISGPQAEGDVVGNPSWQPLRRWTLARLGRPPRALLTGASTMPPG